MFRKAELAATILVDMLTINAAFVLYYLLRVRSGLLHFAIQPEFLLPMVALLAYWMLVFALFGLYRSWYDQSRLDELVSIVRATFFGILVVFFLIAFDDAATASTADARGIIAIYWAMLTAAVAVGRLGLRSIQRHLLLAGHGLRNTVIVGWSRRAQELCDMVIRYPALGYRVVGFIRTGGEERTRGDRHKDLPVLGSLRQMPDIVRRERIGELLIALETTEHDRLMDVIRLSDGFDVGMKIVPDLYDIVSGQARISSLFGFPLMDVRPQLMKPWEEVAKRALDVSVSLVILAFGLPLWILIGILVRTTSRGPVLYRQERVGKNGRIFRMMKFRSMAKDAEKHSGPVWANRNDPRVTRFGRFLRKSHLDEIPQFVNVLTGDMSLVGPRPERPYFVEELSAKIPLYKRRLRVRPGITGWAQVKHKYDETLDDVKTKVKYDLYYIENISWRFDLKILVSTLYVVIMGKGHA